MHVGCKAPWSSKVSDCKTNKFQPAQTSFVENDQDVECDGGENECRLSRYSKDNMFMGKRVG